MSSWLEKVGYIIYCRVVKISCPLHAKMYDLYYNLYVDQLYLTFSIPFPIQHIQGYDSDGNSMLEGMKKTEIELRKMGRLWSKHVLEQVKAYIWCFIYIFATVTTGWPIARAISKAFGNDHDDFYYLIGFIDSAIFFWMPQMAIIMIRIFEGRNLRHRMVTRTVIVGDCPVSFCKQEVITIFGFCILSNTHFLCLISGLASVLRRFLARYSPVRTVSQALMLYQETPQIILL